MKRKSEGSKKGKISYRWRVSTTGKTEGNEKSNTEREEKGDAKAKEGGKKRCKTKGADTTQAVHCLYLRRPCRTTIRAGRFTFSVQK